MTRRSRATATATAVAALVGLLSTASNAWADDESARVHFRRGIDLYDKRQYAPALEEFRAAYAEKPSPGIKQNIALSLKGLGKNVEAATAFDEALDEGRDSLKPETKAAMDRELADLAKGLATITLKVVAKDSKPTTNVTVTVDGKALSPAALRRPVRLEPGIHVFKAHGDGFVDPPEKRLSILAGSPVDATFEMNAPGGAAPPPEHPLGPGGILTVRPSVPGARVRIDGIDQLPCPCSGRVAEGPHRIEATAAGYQPYIAEVIVASGATVDYPISLSVAAELPGYESPNRPPPVKEKHWYIVPMLAFSSESVRLAQVFRDDSKQNRSLNGPAFGVRIGLRLSRYFALELHGEGGRIADSFRATTPQTGTTPPTVAARDTSVAVTHWQVTPAMRFTTGAAFRFVLGTGLGINGRSVDAELGNPLAGTSGKLSGSGVSASWLVDTGIQFDVKSIFLELVGYFDMHGIGTARDESGNRFFLSSPSTRLGVRAGIGIPF